MASSDRRPHEGSSFEHTLDTYRRQCIAKRQADANIELELRFKKDITALHIDRIIKALNAKVSSGAVAYEGHELTLNAISNNPVLRTSKHIMTITFAMINGKATVKNQTFMDKNELVQPTFMNDGACALHVSKETRMSGGTQTNFDVYRFKHRVSYTVNPRSLTMGAADDDRVPRWRIDITISAQFGQVGATVLKGLKENLTNILFTTEDMSKLAELVESPSVQDNRGVASYSFEVEAEYVGSVNALSVDAVNDVANMVCVMLDPDFATHRTLSNHTAALIKMLGLQQSLDRNMSLKSILPQVHNLDKKTYATIFPEIHNYYITGKADGVRTVVMGNNTKVLTLINGSEMTIPLKNDAPNLLIDGELVSKPPLVAGQAFFIFFIFDVMYGCDANYVQKNFKQRLDGDGSTSMSHSIAETLNAVQDPTCSTRIHFMRKPIYEIPKEGEQWRPNPAESVIMMNKLFDHIDAELRQYCETDGLIFISKNGGYMKTLSYKWKPPESLTIDFLAIAAHNKRLPSDVKCPPGFQHYVLCVTASMGQIASLGLRSAENSVTGGSGRSRNFVSSMKPTFFTPPTHPNAFHFFISNEQVAQAMQVHKDCPMEDPRFPLHMKCVELTVPFQRKDDDIVFNLPSSHNGIVPWSLHRVRVDREGDLLTKNWFGNSVITAMSVWCSFLSPFLRKELATSPEAGYFAAAQSASTQAVRRFNNFCKSSIMVPVIDNSNWVVDLACGAGQDLVRYCGRIKGLVGIDRDAHAFGNFITRFIDVTRGPAMKDKKIRTNPYLIAADLANISLDAHSREKLVTDIRAISEFPQDGADVVVCNFAVHYFALSDASLQGFASLCSRVCRIGGRLIFTYMNGLRVRALLEGVELGQRRDRFRGDSLVYSIRREFPNGPPASGQKIGIVLPFSNGELYTEPLVYETSIISALNAVGFDIDSITPFGSYVESFSNRDPAAFASMDDIDKEFTGLYDGLVATRKR